MNSKRATPQIHKEKVRKLSFIIAVFLITFGGLGAIALGTADNVSHRIAGVFFYLVIFAGGIYVLRKNRKKRSNLNDAGAISFEDGKSEDNASEIGTINPLLKSTDKYASTLVRIHELNDNIENEDISEKISRIELITANIFGIIEREPEKSSKVDSFISYYLPSTLKLLDKYSQYEKYGTGENVSDLKKEIEAIIEKLVLGFEKQLDALLLDDIGDVTSDIDVLEAMMKRDGLSNSDFIMGR